jgi:hypothetical protein
MGAFRDAGSFFDIGDAFRDLAERSFYFEAVAGASPAGLKTIHHRYENGGQGG